MIKSKNGKVRWATILPIHNFLSSTVTQTPCFFRWKSKNLSSDFSKFKTAHDPVLLFPKSTGSEETVATWEKMDKTMRWTGAAEETAED